MKHVDQFLAAHKLSPNQISAIHDGPNSIVSHFVSHPCICAWTDLGKLPPQPLLLITGKPGSGKSYCGVALADLLRELKHGHLPATAHYGIASFLVGGSTLHSLFKLGFLTSNNKDEKVDKWSKMVDILPLTIDQVQELRHKLHYKHDRVNVTKLLNK